MKILTPFKMVGRYADGAEIYKGGSSTCTAGGD